MERIKAEFVGRVDDLPVRTDVELIGRYLGAKGEEDKQPVGAAERRLHYLDAPPPFWIELGCGDADITGQLGLAHPDVRILALEVDKGQVETNLEKKRKDGQFPLNVDFGLAGMEDMSGVVPEDGVADAVVMLKSLHHVSDLERGFEEVYRVLKKPGGRLYLSEPLFAGDFHANVLEVVMKDRVEEMQHRAVDAFEAIRKQIAVDPSTTEGGSGKFALEAEVHYNIRQVFPRGYDDFLEKLGKASGADGGDGGHHHDHHGHDHRGHHHGHSHQHRASEEEDGKGEGADASRRDAEDEHEHEHSPDSRGPHGHGHSHSHGHAHHHHHHHHAMDEGIERQLRKTFAEHTTDPETGEAQFLMALRADVLVAK